MYLEKAMRRVLAATATLAGAALCAAAIVATMRPAVAQARAVNDCTHATVCQPASGWQCCVDDGRGGWNCDSNCQPKTEPSLNHRECVGVAPGRPIPKYIQDDLNHQATLTRMLQR